MSRAAIQLIDGNAIGYASHMSTKLANGSKQTQAIFGTIRAIRSLKVDAPRAKQLVLWDGASSWRKKINPQYKESRKRTPEQLKMREEYKAQIPDLKKCLLSLGIDQAWSPQCEADDLAAAYSKLFASRKQTVMMVTSDKDWLQLVNGLVDWCDPVHEKFCDMARFEEVTGYPTAEQFVDAKCLMGDVSDNIKGVGGIGEVGAAKLLRLYGRVEKFLRLYDVNPAGFGKLPKAWKNLAQNVEGSRELFFCNQEIMRLRANVEGVSLCEVTKGQFNKEAFRRQCEDLAFLSITGQFEEWVRPFARN